MNYPQPPAQLVEDWIELAKSRPNRPPNPNKLAELAAAWGYQKCEAVYEAACADIVPPTDLTKKIPTLE